MTDNSPHHPGVTGPLRFFAQVISVLFHPLFTGVWMMAYITFLHPTIFIAVSPQSRLLKMLTFVNNNVVFPMLVVLLLRGLGFSKSVFLRTQQERIVPYIASIIFFFWTWNVFNHQPDAPQVLRDMCQGIFFAVCAALLLNNYFKISMHAIGMGGMFGVCLVIMLSGAAFSPWPLAASVFLSGLVSSARLIASDHEPGDIVTGLLVGLLAQLVAWWI
jgi:hypothetical protein